VNWLQKAAAVVSRVLSIRDPEHWRNRELEPDSGEPVTEGTALTLSAVFGCVNLLAGTIGSLPLMVYRTDAKGNRTVAKDHPLYRILHDSPNADQTALDFWEYGEAAIELRGNFHARKDQVGDRLIGLTPILAEVEAKRAGNGAIKYTWTENGRRFEDIDQAEIFHVRGFGGSPLGGLSTLSLGRQAFGLARAENRAAAGTFKNGLRPSGVMTFSQFLKPEQRKTIEEGLERKYMGAVNSGRPMILEGGTTWTQLSITPEDAQMLESRAFSIEEVCRFFGVPPFMIGHTEKTTSWGTGLSEQVLGFQKFTLRRRLKRIEMAAEKQLLTAQDRAAGVTIEFNLEGLLRGDSAARAAFYNAGLNNGWMTINEVRGLENLPPVEGGEIPRLQMQNVPLTEAGQVQTVTPPAPRLPAANAA
jgi:HK97 family phage portal protein